MASWADDEINKVGAAEELEIAPIRSDGTLRKPVTIWVVRIGDELYVRCSRGLNGPWFRAAQERHEGRIQAGGVEKPVTFVEESNHDINDQIDAAYRTKYSHYPQWVPPIVTAEARLTTLKLVPH